MNLIYKNILLAVIINTWIFASDIHTVDYNNNFLTHAELDLNSDGKKEKISIKSIKTERYSPDEDNFELMVDDVLITGNLIEGHPDGFVIVDINKNDKYKEIAVHAPGASYDDEVSIYSYDGKSLKKMGGLYQWPTFYGNGIVLVDYHIDFWSKRVKYVLDKKTRTLNLVPQKFYYVGIKGKVTKSFPLYRTKKIKDIIANLKPHSEILILVCEPSLENKDPDGVDIKDYSYLVKSSTGLVGWTTHQAFWDNVDGLPQGD